MVQLNQVDRVVFTEDPHEYILDGSKKLIGLTQLMSKHGLSANYGNISQEVLDHAAELGTQAHNAIEAYCDGLPVTETPLIKSFKKLGLNVIATEYLITDYETVATKIDLVVQVDENTVDIVDMKRTSSVHKDALAWQLSGCRYLFNLINPKIKVRNLYCLPIKKGNTDDIAKDKCGALVEIDPVSEWDVRALIDCERLGVKFEKKVEDDPTTALAETFVAGHYPALISSLRKMKELERAIEEAKAGLMDFMTEHNIEKLDLEDVTVTVKKPYFSSRFDTKAFRKDYPELGEKYTQQTEVAGSITIKLK